MLRTNLAWAILVLVIVVIASIIIGSSAGTGNYEGSLFGGFSVLGVFFTIDIILWVNSIGLIIRKHKDKQAIESGVVCEATYVSHKLTATVNGVGIYKVFYKCNNKGITKKYSSVGHSYAEAIALQDIKTFKVKVSGNHAVIVEDLQNIDNKNEIEYLFEGLTKNKQKKVKCQYCGSYYDSSLSKCPNCGASKNK